MIVDCLDQAIHEMTGNVDALRSVGQRESETAFLLLRAIVGTLYPEQICQYDANIMMGLRPIFLAGLH